jgi:hypothetical protein
MAIVGGGTTVTLSLLGAGAEEEDVYDGHHHQGSWPGINILPMTCMSRPNWRLAELSGV